MDKDKIRAISLWQPWAGGIALGIKKQETRPWATKVRGDIVICSAKKKVHQSLYPKNYQEVWKQSFVKDRELLEIKGYALCIVEIYDCVSSNDPAMINSSETELMWGDYSPDRYIWLTRNLRLIDPVPVKGSQGFFFIDNDIIKKIKNRN